MLNFGPVYTFFKSEFLRNEHGDPLFFSVQSTRDMMSFVCAKLKKKKSVRWKNLSYTSLNPVRIFSLCPTFLSNQKAHI